MTATPEAGQPIAASAPETVLVVPCYNEATRLSVDAFDRFLGSYPRVGFLLVNDGSRDDTLQVLRAIAARHRDGVVEVLDLGRNRGKAEAVRLGLLRALERSSTFVGFWDADLATPLEAIIDFRGLLFDRPTLDWVIGARVKLLGRRIDRQALRHYLGRVFATAASLTLGIAVYDTQCGAKLFRRNPELEAVLQESFASRWVFDVELMGRYLNAWRRQGDAIPEERIMEYPLHSWHDVRGSKVVPTDFLRAFLELAGIAIRLRRDARKPGPGPRPARPALR
jgi:glycosyltransferase involved in cell wall biosynthesis